MKEILKISEASTYDLYFSHSQAHGGVEWLCSGVSQFDWSQLASHGVILPDPVATWDSLFSWQGWGEQGQAEACGAPRVPQHGTGPFPNTPGGDPPTEEGGAARFSNNKFSLRSEWGLGSRDQIHPRAFTLTKEGLLNTQGLPKKPAGRIDQNKRQWTPRHLQHSKDTFLTKATTNQWEPSFPSTLILPYQTTQRTTVSFLRTSVLAPLPDFITCWIAGPMNLLKMQHKLGAHYVSFRLSTRACLTPDP